MKSAWEIWKHALGSFSDEQTKGKDDIICLVRSTILLINIVAGIMIIANIIHNW